MCQLVLHVFGCPHAPVGGMACVDVSKTLYGPQFLPRFIWRRNAVGPRGTSHTLVVASCQVAPGEQAEVEVTGSEKRPTGRVVAVIRRNWRSRGYCGSLQPPKHGAARSGHSASLLFMPVERRLPLIR